MLYLLLVFITAIGLGVFVIWVSLSHPFNVGDSHRQEKEYKL